MPNEHETVCIGIDDLRYPPILRLIQGPPAMLRCRGDISVLSRPAVAVVGARKVTEYGKWAAFNLGKTLAEYGLTVVSGMAWGADSWA
ncbi:MAG: DNA-protecting protein DprA, partial [Clostridiales Family XIII bacterium]|nr:DNA-protecting protein DprA [Clostridiales Family XIII bacterium]